MPTITKMLDSYADIMTTAICLEDQIKLAAPDLWVQREAALKSADALKGEIKDKAKFIPQSQAHTLIGKLFQMVWKPGRDALDEEKITSMLDRLNALTGETNALDSLKTAQAGWWEVRKVGKKK